MKLGIRYMVSRRCKMVVKEELAKMGLHYIFLDPPMVEIMETLTEKQYDDLNTNLQRWGLELMDDKNRRLVQQIKKTILDMIHSEDGWHEFKYSEYLSRKFHHDYTDLANIFSEVNGISIQKFIINNKIERVKELMMHDGLNLTEISYKLNYCNVAHLSHQFKQVTGLTPSSYKQLKQTNSYALEGVR